MRKFTKIKTVETKTAINNEQNLKNIRKSNAEKIGVTLEEMDTMCISAIEEKLNIEIGVLSHPSGSAGGYSIALEEETEEELKERNELLENFFKR